MQTSQCRLSGDKPCFHSLQSIHDPTGLSTKDERRLSNRGLKPVLTLVAKPSVFQPGLAWCSEGSDKGHLKSKCCIAI